MSKKMAIVYFSHTGATRMLAERISAGSTAAGVTTTQIEILSSDIVEGRYIRQDIFNVLQQQDAIVFGSPTYMGSAAAQFKAFMDASSNDYVDLAWRNKLAAGFTVGGSLNGEQQQTLLSFFTLACQHAMLWAGLDTSQHNDQLKLNRTGSSIGLVASTLPDSSLVDDNDLATAYYFGQRLAHCLSLHNH